jgi:hypothetical protein
MYNEVWDEQRERVKGEISFDSFEPFLLLITTTTGAAAFVFVVYI